MTQVTVSGLTYWREDGYEFKNISIWLELSVWGDSVGAVLVWEGDHDGFEGFVTINVRLNGTDYSLDTPLGTENATILLTAQQGGGIVVNTGLSGMDQLEVSVGDASRGIGGTSRVIKRPRYGDVFVEVPSTLPRCSYSTGCDGGYAIPFELNNTGNSPLAVHLSLSRNFYIYGIGQLGATGAEM